MNFIFYMALIYLNIPHITWNSSFIVFHFPEIIIFQNIQIFFIQNSISKQNTFSNSIQDSRVEAHFGYVFKKMGWGDFRKSFYYIPNGIHSTEGRQRTGPTSKKYKLYSFHFALSTKIDGFSFCANKFYPSFSKMCFKGEGVKLKSSHKIKKWKKEKIHIW